MDDKFKEIYDKLTNMSEEEKLRMQVEILSQENARLKEELQAAQNYKEHVWWQSIKNIPFI
jgi:hypothetical protein